MTASPAQLRAEGVTELLGDILLQCSGSAPGTAITGNLTIGLPVSVTNRVGSTGLSTDALVFADFGGGFTPLPVAAQITNQVVFINGLNFTPSAANFSLRISNIRAAVNQLGASSNPVPVNASISFSGRLLLNQANVTVGYIQSGLLATLYNRGVITCSGSPLPATITMSNLFSTGTFFASNRITEGFAAAFQPRHAGEDNGTRVLLQFTGVPAGARLFVPDYVAGSSAAVPTAGGDLGVPQSGGVYVAGSGTLLLGRLANADSSGAGGTVTLPAGSGSVALDSASEVSLSSGNGYAVFEVLDAQPTRQETAQIPIFVGMDFGAAPGSAQENITFGPLSTALTASTTAPIPRFAGTPPAPDCSALADCNSGFFPKLSVQAEPIGFTAIVNGATRELWGNIIILNSGNGVMPWTASVQYLNGAGWIVLSQTTGDPRSNSWTIRVFADPKGLATGTYKANVVVDAGTAAGTATIPVTLTVLPVPTPPSGSTGGTGSSPGSSGAGSTTGSSSGSTSGSTAGSGSTSGTGSSSQPPAANAVTILKIVNAATFESTPLVPGSLGTVMGTNLAGKSVSVTLDGVAADLLFDSPQQINLRVPLSLRGKNSALMVVTVDGASSAPQTVVLASAWPAIFHGGVLNQDNTVNGLQAAAGAGSILQIFATGIPDGATVSAQIAGRKDLIPLYAGPAPSVPGVQQVNVAVPDGVDAGTAQLSVCAAVGGQQFCSPAFELAVR